MEKFTDGKMVGEKIDPPQNRVFNRGCFLRLKKNNLCFLIYLSSSHTAVWPGKLFLIFQKFRQKFSDFCIFLTLQSPEGLDLTILPETETEGNDKETDSYRQ
jgi:hypothetical protein